MLHENVEKYAEHVPLGYSVTGKCLAICDLGPCDRQNLHDPHRAYVKMIDLPLRQRGGW